MSRMSAGGHGKGMAFYSRVPKAMNSIFTQFLDHTADAAFEMAENSDVMQLHRVPAGGEGIFLAEFSISYLALRARGRVDVVPGPVGVAIRMGARLLAKRVAAPCGSGARAGLLAPERPLARHVLRGDPAGAAAAACAASCLRDRDLSELCPPTTGSTGPRVIAYEMSRSCWRCCRPPPRLLRRKLQLD